MEKKSMKSSFIIYADLEPLLKKMSTRHNNPEKLSRAKMNKHAPSGYSFVTQCSFDSTKNKLDCYRGRDFKEHASEIIISEKKKWYHWQIKRTNHISIKKFVIYPKKRFSTDDDKK